MIGAAFQGFFTDFHFLRPLFLLAIIPAVLLGIMLVYLRGQSTQWTRSIDPTLLPFLLDKADKPKQNLPVIGLLTLWVISIVALSGPAWQQLPMPVQEKEDALIIVMDLSLSMYADDLPPNRITRARRKIVDILNLRSDEGQTALIVYAGDAHAVTPITDDTETINNLVASLDPNIMPVPGSKPVDGITLAIELLDNASIDQARIMLITDGVRRADINPINNLINPTNHELVILGVATEEGSPIPTSEGGFLRDQSNAIVIPRLERALLQEIVDATGGRYADAQLGDDDVNFLLAEGLFEQNENLTDTEREFDSWYETGPWLVLLILPFAALAFRQGWLLCIPLLFILTPPSPVQAAEWDNLWQNSDQQGSNAFDNERYQNAADDFNDPAWRAASNYRLGNFEEAVNDLAELEDEVSHYNRGNALANLFRLEEALGAYDQALAQNPDFEDALRNKRIVEDLLEQQEEEEQEQQEGEDQEQDEQGQDQESQEQQESDQESQDSDQQSGEQEDQQPQDQQQQQEGEQDQEQQESDQEPQDSEQQQEQQEQEFQAREVDSEEEQSMQQWLGRIQDDPGELLRNKFRQQSQQQLFEQIQNPDLARERAQEPVW